MIPRALPSPRGARGVTLVELIAVITITAIVASVVAVFVLRPVQGYVDLSRRATLVDTAESALRRMARDIRIALPNSLRVATPAAGFVIELLPIVDAGRYAVAEATACENLTGISPAAADDQFDILGTFPTIANGAYPSHRLVINNQGVTGHDVYADGVTPSPAAPLVITPVGTSITIATGTCGGNGKSHVSLSAPHQFKTESPRDRVYIVTTPVTYLCDTTAGTGTLVRYSGYEIQGTQVTTAAGLNALPGVSSARVADRVTGCTATTLTTDVQDRGLVTLRLTLSEQGEQITLTHQVQLDNSP
jgi:MSHA biogenesis protein MshO